MGIRLFMNDYMDIFVKEDGTVYVEIGKINANNETSSENMYANSSFETFMKYLGINIADIKEEISKYLSDNELFLRIKRNETAVINFNLHDLRSKEELVSYETFEDLIKTEIYQIHDNETEI